MISFTIIPNAVLGQTFTFQSVYQHLMTRQRMDILSSCSLGRKWNTIGMSYWDEARTWFNEDAIRKVGQVNFDIYQSAYAAAMNELCPDVR